MGQNANTVWARAFVDELARAGLREACLAPGSRSTPLVLALERTEGIRTRIHLDERAAAFFAVGAAKASREPVAVVTTSGTAVGNLLPAVMEASLSGAPLLLLTADRPARLRGTDANQTARQPGIFGSYVRMAHQVAAPEVGERALRYLRSLAGRAMLAAREPPAGPVHLDFPFEKPLAPERGAPPGGAASGSGDVPPGFAGSWPLAAGGRAARRPYTRAEPARRAASPETLDRLADLASRADRGLLVCGPVAEPGRLGPAAVELARAAGWPLLADPLSGARFAEGAGEVAVEAYDLVLGAPGARAALAPDLVLRAGAAPTSSALLAFLEDRREAEQVVVDDGFRWADHVAVSTEYVRADPAGLCRELAARAAGGEPASSAWAGAWRRAGAAAAAVLADAREGPFFEGAVLREVARRVPAGGLLWIGSSMPVRDLDAFGAPRSEPVEVLGHRGVSGIDGGVSGALGAAAVSDGPSVAVLGDLAFHHDLTGLQAAGSTEADLVVVVVNNDGGGIFHLLPIRRHEPPFTRAFATPHGLDFRHAAEMYGVPFRRVEGAGATGAALAEGLDAGGVRIVEVTSDREENRKRREEVCAAVHEAVEAALG